jgi:hypothetical protein
MKNNYVEFPTDVAGNNLLLMEAAFREVSPDQMQCTRGRLASYAAFRSALRSSRRDWVVEYRVPVN